MSGNQEEAKKFNIWAGYLAWARQATARPVNTSSPKNDNENIAQEKLCSAHTLKIEILLELLGPSCRSLLVQFSRLLTT